LPDIPGLKNFDGTVLHSSQYTDGEDWKGKSALVVGTGNSGHDIAQDLHSSGANVTLVQRSSTLITNIEPSAQLAYAAYNEGSLEDNDLIATSMPLALAKRSHVMLTEQSKKFDQELLDGLARVGFKLDFGDGGTGWQFKYLTRGGGYYFNVGCSDLVARGEIGLRQFSDIEAFAAEGARMKSGETLAADLIVLATGYKPQEHLVRKLFGEQVTDRVGPIWGSARGKNCATCIPGPASAASGSSPAAWRSAGSTRNISRCRSRPSRKDCCRGSRVHFLPLSPCGRGWLREAKTGEGVSLHGENPSSGADFVHATFSHRGRREERKHTCRPFSAQASIATAWWRTGRNCRRAGISPMSLPSQSTARTASTFSIAAPHPMVVLDREGNFIRSWGEGLFSRAPRPAYRRRRSSLLHR